MGYHLLLSAVQECCRNEKNLILSTAVYMYIPSIKSGKAMHFFSLMVETKDLEKGKRKSICLRVKETELF